MRVLITGTASGIGYAAALKFLAEGHEVIGFDICDVKASLNNHANYKHYIVDICDKDNFPSIDNIQILVNNAGVQNANDIDVNLKGTINITETYGIQEEIKSIVMIGSASGHTGAEFPEYSASKGGILSYTKNVALRIAKYGATCNSLDFGGVSTELNKPVMDDDILWKQIMDLTPLKRWMTPEETADWIYFISVVNKFCTGQNILIDGLEAGNANFVWPEQ